MLFILLFALSLAVDPLSSLGSDVGGKTATMTALSSSHSLDLGYWAAALDPDGSLYPFFGTSVLDGRWINATTFPMLFLAWPLHTLGGMRLAMILPVLGGVFTATAARRLATMLGPTDGTAAFWIVGLGTPVAVYSLAFWEHAPGLALMAWGIVQVVAAIDSTRIRSAVSAGLLFGLAATMRQEALVYGALAGAWLVAGLVTTARPIAAVRSATAMAVSAVAMLMANSAFERLVLGSVFRSSRAGGTASAVGTKLDARMHDALVTILVPSTVDAVGVALGIVVVVGSVLLVRQRGPLRESPLIAAMVVVPFLLVGALAVVDGRSFVPSMVFAAPLVGVGATLGWQDRRTRPPVVFAVVALPLILAAQSTGGFEAQWGGRYLLLSGWVLTVTACSRHGSMTRSGFAVMAAASLLITGLGVGWTVERSHAMADFYGAIEARHSPVVVFDSSLTARGAGSIMFDQPMLAAADETDRAEAARLLQDAGVASFLFVAPDVGTTGPTFDGFVEVESTTIDFVSGLQFRARTFVPVG